MTLASYWTRAGAAILDKPLVLGPVGGGVETPWRLTPELGWRGVCEDLVRVVTRRTLGHMGPARRAQHKARVTFAQNHDTASRLNGSGDVIVLSNATAVDVNHIRPAGPRTKDIYLVGRLAPWKAPILAVRAMRYVTEPECILHICGNGPERQRVERAARRWGVANRVRFDGWFPRDVLLERIASAGALLHPALHEEAGLCVAEALAMGTPVVCLDRGGPAEILTQWPQTMSVAVKPADARSTARAMAAAIDEFLAHPPEVRHSPLPAKGSFEEQVLEAYDYAVRKAPLPRHRLRPVVWAFPRGKPQVFANTPRAVGSGISVYAFGRRVPMAVQAAAVAHMSVPGLRSFVAERRGRPDPVCGWDLWDGILDEVVRTMQCVPRQWLYFRSQWAKQRSSALALNDVGMPLLFVAVEPRSRASVHPNFAARSFRVPRCLDSFDRDGWRVRVIEPLPRYHRAAGWDIARIRQVVEDIPQSLDGLIARPARIPMHWVPLHGDFVPWNLREDGRRRLWLVDWEDSGWGPPFADAVRYFVASRSLVGVPPRATALTVRRIFGEESVDLEEIANFWLQHRNFRADRTSQELTWRKAREAVRGGRETDVFRLLSGAEPEH